MKQLTSIAIAAVAALGPIPALCATQDVALSKVAAEAGYTYAYLGAQDAVTLTRPGLTVLVRPGQSLIEVNDRSESTDTVPHYANNDVYVSVELERRLRTIASRYPVAQAPAPAEPSTPPQGIVPQAAPQGTIAVDAHQVPGAQLFAVSGTAPASVPIFLTLVATFSSDLPDTVLSRTIVASDASGRFTAIVPAAGGEFRGSLLNLVATSLPSVTKATIPVVLKAPNGTITVPADEVPRSVR